MRESSLKEVYSASLGFSVEQDSNWRGMYFSDPFHLAEAVVVVDIDGVSDIDQVKGHRFPLSTDSDEDIFASLRRRVEERYPDEASNLVKVELSNGLEAVSNNNKELKNLCLVLKIINI